MLLDYVPSTKAFTLKVPRGSADVQSLMSEAGFDFSLPASTAQTAVLFTKEPYAAAAYGQYATPQARAELHGILTEIDASRSAGSLAPAPGETARYRVPADQELWPFQKADLAYALRRRNTLIGDQPGLGKTPTSIVFANEIGAERVLVLCPASIRLQWVKRIREWTTLRWPYTVHAILNGRNGVHPTANWTVVSYDLARTEAIGRALARHDYDLLILDEAHYLKSHDAGRTRAVFGGGHLPFSPLAEKSQRILALTGTPLPNRPREAYTLARGLCWDSIDWLSEDKFKERFNPSIRVERIAADGRRLIYNDERSGRHAELQARLRANFMVRHLKREVLPQLKMPIYDIIQLEETGPVKQALAAESLLDIDPENLTGADLALFGGHIAVVRKQMGLALAPQVADYVEMLLDGGEDKLVLFAWHIEVMNLLQERLQRHGVVRIDGSTGAVKKQKLVDKFIDDPGIQVCLGNIQSMGVGTDGLQKVSCHALIAEPSWTSADNEQAFDRLDRGGQARQVQGDIFCAPNSFAERILASALRKHHVTHKALDRRL